MLDKSRSPCYNNIVVERDNENLINAAVLE